MKAVYILILFIVLAGISLSIFLIPTNEDLAFMALKTRKYAKAKKYYLLQYQEGNRSANVMLSLSILYERQGNLKEAVAIIKEYIAEHPLDFEALEKLADLYRLDLQRENYFQTLLKLNAKQKKGNKDVIIDLIDEYPRLRTSLMNILEKGVKTGNADESDYLLLAYLYAAKKEYQKALFLLKTRRSFWEDKIVIDDILFEVWLYAHLEKTEATQAEKSKILLDYLLKEKNRAKIYQAFGLIEDLDPEFIPIFLEKLQLQIHQNPLLEIEVLQYKLENHGKKKEITSQLQRLQKKIPDNVRLQNVLFDLYLDTNDEAHLVKLIRTKNFQEIEQNSIINLIIYSIENQDTTLSEEMKYSLGPDYLKRYPVIAIALSIGLQEMNAEEQLNQYVSTTNLTQTERYYLLRVAGAAQFDGLVIDIGKKLPPYIGMDEIELMNIALIYSKIHQEKWLYSALKNSLLSLGQKEINEVLILLDISLGNSKKAAMRLSNVGKLKEDVFGGMYTLAQEKKEYSLALYIAKRWNEYYVSNLVKANYGFSLARVGKEDAGFSIVQRLYQNDPNDDELRNIYFSTLVLLAKKNPTKKELLKDYLKMREKNGGLLLEEEEAFASAYLEIFHDDAKTEAILWKLSEGAPPQNSALQSLIYFWGPDPTIDKVKWMEKRAELAAPIQLGYWLEYLNYIGRYQKVIHLFQDRQKENENLTFRDYVAYMEALNHLKRKDELKRTIDLLFPKIFGKKDLETLSVYAEESEDQMARRRIWERITKYWKNDPVGWQELGRIAFDQGDYSLAKKALDHFFNLCCENTCISNVNLYESYFIYSKVLKNQWSMERAREFNLCSLKIIEMAKEKTFRMQEIEGLNLYSLGYCLEAKNMLLSLYKLESYNPNVGADYVNLLMDEGKLGKAQRFLDEGAR